ncbi:unnamed protein product [Closterium sp. NIES-64]|nr:unnamed protein product [Closterium sp. NIES-64]
MYAVTISDEADCYRCFPPDPGIETAALGTGEAAALGARASAPSGAGESALSGTASASASHTFTLDSGASRSFFRDRTTLTPLGRPIAVSLADPSGGPVLAHYSTVPRVRRPPLAPCLVFTSPRLYELAPPPWSPLPASSPRNGLPCPCLWSSPVPLSPSSWAWPYLRPCVAGRQRAVPHSSQFPPTEAPLQTLHMDVWGPARVRGQGHERYFLLVVDDYSRYTTVFPCAARVDVSVVLID